MTTSPGKCHPELDEILQSLGLTSMTADDKAARESILAKLKFRGLTVQQIERITGIGRNTIARAK